MHCAIRALVLCVGSGAAVVLTALTGGGTAAFAAADAANPAVVSDPASLVNTLLGTQPDPGINPSGSVNAFPGPDLPFGMIQWGPDTSPDRMAGGGYDWDDTTLRGFSLTHLSGPGCGALGDIPILPLTGGVAAGTDPGSVMQPLSHTGEVTSAGYYRVLSGSPVISTELTATLHSAMARFTFPATSNANLIVKLLDSQNGSVGSGATVVSNTEVSGSTTSGFFCGANDQYTVNFDLVFDHPFTASQVVTEPGQPGPNSVVLTFDTTKNQQLLAKVGISFVSAANARLNWMTDNPGWSFESVRSAAHAAWNAVLSRIGIGGGSQLRQQVFYTNLYHMLLHPNIFSDANGQYIGFDNAVHAVPAGHAQYANFSGWDVYRSQFEVLAMLAPNETSDIVQSMLNDAAQNHGMLPKWALENGESYVMVGDPADGEIAGAYAFGARGFDTATALSDMLAEATKPSNIRPGLDYYQTLGYLPADGTYGCCNFYGPVSTQLEYNMGDFALSQFAAALGDTADSQMLLNRVNSWQNLVNPATGLLQARNLAGQFVPASMTTMSNYVEGDASQYRWIVPWDKAGLVAALGGPARVNSALDTFWTLLNDGPGSPYAFWDNQFAYETPWTYDFTGQPWKTQALVNRIRTQLYLDNPSYEGDNDDLGATASMGVLTSLGFYTQYIGNADVTLNSPEFPVEIIHLGNGQTIDISARQASSTAIYIQSMRVNGQPWNKPWLPGSTFTTGARIDFTLGTSPNTSWGAAPADAPPSYTNGQYAAFGLTTPANGLVVSPGGTAPASIGAQSATGVTQTITWTATASSGVTVTPSSGTFQVGPEQQGSQPVTISAGSAEGRFTVTFKLTSSTNQAVPSVSLQVAVARPGELWPYRNNVGIEADGTGTANYDGVGFSYSQNALTDAHAGPGAAVTAGGISYTMPVTQFGPQDNVQVAGQTLTLPSQPASATRLGFLGSATNCGPGGTSGTVTVQYTDGTTSTGTLGMSDWTLGAGSFPPSFGDLIAVTTPYRDTISGGMQTVNTYLFADSFAITAGKTIAQITLPGTMSNGCGVGIFAIAAG